MKALQRHGTQSPAVTIGLPVFNGELFLAKRLDNILTQTFSDFTLIISDNASSDATQEIALTYARTDHRIRYIRQPKNHGAIWNFNFVISQCSSRYFVIAAVDDLWAPDFLQKLVSAMAEDDSIAIAFSPFVIIDGSGSEVGGLKYADYPNHCPFLRFYRFAQRYKDHAVYGLMRGEWLRELRLHRWWEPNRDVIHDNAYPLLSGLLAKGRVVNVVNHPLFYLRIWYHDYESDHYFPETYLRYILLKFNVFFACLRNVYIGSRSIGFTMAVAPLLFMRAVVECFNRSRYIRLAWRRFVHRFISPVRITLERYVFWRWMKERR